MNNAAEWIIDVDHLNKSFSGKPAVIDLSLKIKRGEIVGFLGSNGSGKTTTIRMLCGLLTPDSGQGHCLGFDIVGESAQIKRQVGYMTQRFSLYEDLSIYENLDFTANLYQIENAKQEIAATLEQLNLESRKNQLAGTLSGGWKQRLALACCLLHKPQLLLLDEPTAGVDPKARREFWDHIHQLAAQGITTLVSTHYMDEAERCTKLAYISIGHLLTYGTAAEIIKESQLHIWAVTGGNLTELAAKLRELPGIEQVIFFGETLHISGKNAVLMEQSLAPYRQAGLQFKEIPACLEDVFISLVGKTKE